MGRNPLFSALLGILLLALLAVGTICFFITSAAGGVLLATVGSHAVINRLEAAQPNPSQHEIPAA
jgi:hypothetical protein